MTITKIYRKLAKFIFLLFFFVLVLFCIIIPIHSTVMICSESVSKEIYKHHSNGVTIDLYDTTKNNRFRITADHVKYFNNEKIIWFTKPEIVIFLKNTIPIWKISCDQAKLKKNLFDLYGCVYISRIINNKYAESIITNHVLMDLIDHSMVSNDKTIIIHGYYFYSISSRMHVNFKTQIIKLFGKIYTQYEAKRL